GGIRLRTLWRHRHLYWAPTQNRYGGDRLSVGRGLIEVVELGLQGFCAIAAAQRCGRQSTIAPADSARRNRVPSGTATTSPVVLAVNTRRREPCVARRRAFSLSRRSFSAASCRMRLIPARLMPSSWERRCTSRSTSTSRAE